MSNFAVFPQYRNKSVVQTYKFPEQIKKLYFCTSYIAICNLSLLTVAQFNTFAHRDTSPIHQRSSSCPTSNYSDPGVSVISKGCEFFEGCNFFLAHFENVLKSTITIFSFHWMEQKRGITDILKAGFAGFQKPQKILNFPEKEFLRKQKLSILQNY